MNRVPQAAAALAAAAMLLPALADAAPRRAAAAEARPPRISRLVIYGRDACPRGAAGEVIVCARRPDSERYRIPEALRDDGTADDPESTSWAARAESLEYVGRTGIQSCSTVGPGGFTGCWAELMRAARGDRSTPPKPEPGR